MTDQLPENLLRNVVVCRCQKSKCNKQGCVCKQNGLAYTEIYGCIEGKNELKEYN